MSHTFELKNLHTHSQTKVVKILDLWKAVLLSVHLIEAGEFELEIVFSTARGDLDITMSQCESANTGM